MKIKGIILTAILGLLSVLFLVSPTPATAQTYNCSFVNGFCNVVDTCGPNYELPANNSNLCRIYNGNPSQCANQQNNPCIKKDQTVGGNSQDCRPDGTCDSGLSCNTDFRCCGPGGCTNPLAKVCGVDTFKGKKTFCDFSPINREIVTGDYTGCNLNGHFGEQCLTDLSPTSECTGLQVNNTSGSSVVASANGCIPNNNYKLDIRTADGSSSQASGTSDANGHLTMSFDIQQPGTYTFNLYNLTTGSFSVAGTTASVTGIGGGSNLPGAGTGSSTGDIKCSDGNSIDTAIGCIPIGDQNALIGFFLKWGIGIGGGIAFILIIFAGFQIMTSRGDPNRLKAGQELMTSAIAGLLLLIFSLIILRIIGFDILNITAFQ